MERLIEIIKHHDFYFEMSDDGTKYSKGRTSEKMIIKGLKELMHDDRMLIIANFIPNDFKDYYRQRLTEVVGKNNKVTCSRINQWEKRQQILAQKKSLTEQQQNDKIKIQQIANELKGLKNA